MKQGIETLEKLAGEVMRQKKAKRDFMIETANVFMGSKAELEIPGMGVFQGNTVFHEQVASKTGIPKKYYDLMLEKSPELLSRNVNHWFKANPEQRMVRVLDKTARAMLSSRYRPLDNWIVLEAALKALEGTNFRLESSEITERRMYVQITFPDMAAKMGVALEQFKRQMTHAPGHFWEEILAPGLVISNSEVGCGAVNVESLIYTYRCTNGAIMSNSMKKYHVGKEFGGDEGNQEIFSAATNNQADKLFVMKIHDVMKAASNPEVFNNNIKKIGDAANSLMGKDIPKNVEAATELFDLREDEEAAVLNHLIKGGDFSKWGLSSAVTRTAQDSQAYDRAIELEKIGGRIIEMAPKDWASMMGNN